MEEGIVEGHYTKANDRSATISPSSMVEMIEDLAALGARQE